MGLLWLCLGAALLYTGGMFLNDAVDADWDRRHRAERPIPAGRISRRAVGTAAGLLLAAGWLVLLAVGVGAAVWGLALVAAIVLYDVVHKHFPPAPLLMAACRALLYLAAAGAVVPAAAALRGAGAIAAYIAGLSFLARHESTGVRVRIWPVGLLLVPLAIVAAAHPAFLATPAGLCAAAAFLLWTLWCLRRAFYRTPPQIGPCVGGLLAGIPFVDALAVPARDWGELALFAGLFLAARAAQRWVPAT